MKRNLLTVIILAIALTATAQVTQQFGIQLGSEGNVLRHNSSAQLDKLNVQHNLNGPTIGIAYEVNFAKGIGLYFAANYSYSMQSKKTESSMSNNYQTRLTTHYHSINIPLHLQYKYLLAKNTWLGIYTGPMFQYGLSFRQVQQTEIPIAGVEPTRAEPDNYYYTYDYYHLVNQSFLNSNADADSDTRIDLNRFSPKWGVGAIFQFYQFYVRGGYNWGIINNYYDRTFTNYADTSKEWKRRVRNDEWNVTIGWYFGYTK